MHDEKRKGHYVAETTSSSRPWQFILGLIIIVGIVFRLIDLDHLPGINGDEAWYGVQMLHLRAGEHAAWRTPTGNLIGPLHASLLFLLQLIFAPSFFLLRIPAVVAGITQIFLTFFVIRRHFTLATAWVGATLTAVLPANIAYSRFGWDVSYSGIGLLIATHFALLGNLVGLILSYALLLWIHPTNVFSAPFLLIIYGSTLWQKRGRRVALKCVISAAVIVPILTALLLRGIMSMESVAVINVHDVATRLLGMAEWWRFAILLERFLSGDVSYEYIVGRWMGHLPSPRDVIVLTAMVTFLILAIRCSKGVTAWRYGAVTTGTLTSVSAFAITVGARGVTPHSDRYGYCLLVPCVLTLAVAFTAIADVRAWVGRGLVCVISVILLVSFYNNYFGALQRTGSLSHPTFWTGKVEPKQEAVRRILTDVPSGRRVEVAADSWWTYWPILYLLFYRREIHVTLYEGKAVLPDTDLLYLVGFPGGPLDSLAKGRLPVGCSKASLGVPGYGRKIAISVWRVECAQKA